MHRNTTLKKHMLVFLFLIVSPIAISVTVVHSETLIWEDIEVPFKQLLRFSVNEKVVVGVNIPGSMLAKADRISIFHDIFDKNPRLRPYVMVNSNRNAIYNLGGNGIVNIRSAHLAEGRNELRYGDRTTTGDLIFVYELRLVESKN